jgi:transcription elongation GreA/GreB family factor
LKLKLQQLHPLSKELHELKDKLQATEKELTQTRREMDLKEQLSNKRDEALRENLQLYKQTIANLTD